VDLGLKNKVAVITGGSQGIGLAVAEGLAEEGVHIAICARNEALTLEMANHIAQKYGVKTFGMKTDVSKVEDIDAFVSEVVRKFGGVDILINNAGVGTAETIMNAPDEKWQYYWDFHVMAAIRLARAFVLSMRERGGGVILNNASICATQPIYREPIYNTTKAALVMMTKCLAEELIPFNIRVNAVNPGLILTEGWTKHAEQVARETNQTAEDVLTQIAKENAPIGRFATTDELANFFVFLCSPKASYCVGSSYYVDGGWLKVVN